ncbi:hypothetical protein ACJIZ3_004217 [Penstemon smallii]|uniref:L10-interacting MYB domain-containing protein n=1 Tax=Penstemon smallii TaxID=265156 RepID=A0ABD3S1K5_9LAMI
MITALLIEAIFFNVLGMDNQVSSGERPRTTWTTAMDQHFVSIMLEQVQMGFRDRSSFTKDSWLEMANSMNKKFGLQLDKDILKCRFKKFKQKYNIMKVLLQHDGFNWDETRDMITAADDVWDSYLKAHPEAKALRNRSVPNFKDFCVIYVEDSTSEAENVAENIDTLPQIDITDINVDDISGISPNDMNLSSIRPLQICEGPEMRTPSTNDRQRLCWTPTMDRYFVEIMVEQVHNGYKNNTIFRTIAWRNMVVLFNKKFGLSVEMDFLKNRIKKLRLKYHTLKSLLDHEGFVWDDTRQMVKADDLVWDEYIKAHPEARSYRTTTVPDYANLSFVFGNENAKARGSVSHSVDLANEILQGRVGEESKATESPNISAAHGDQCVSSQSMDGLDKNNLTPQRPKTTWSPPMDRYFIELMLEHTNQGNTTSTSFSKEAWASMVEFFNSKFGLQADKEILRSRFRRLRKQYNATRDLLNYDGFQWDETRKMVFAEDSVWDKYLKEHPKARAFRNKRLPDYPDFCVIYGNSIADYRQSFSDQQTDMQETSEKEVPLLEGPTDDILESSSHSSGGLDTSNQFRKRPLAEPSNSNSRKAQKSTDENMADALRQMASAVTSLANGKKEKENSISCDEVVKALKNVPDIDEDLFLDACDLLEDEQKAKMFMALDVSIRKKWLIRKLRPL